MRNIKKNERKLDLKKFQIAKIANPRAIVGGFNIPLNNDNDDDPLTGDSRQGGNN